MTDNELLVKAALRHYNHFAVPTRLVSSRSTKRKYTADEKADLDIKTSTNKIGEIINLSQELNTLLWDKLNTGASIEDVHDLYCDISILDVLSNIEIDKAKKEYAINSTKEIKDLSNKYLRTYKDGRKIKPNFFGAVARAKGYYDNKSKTYQFHNTTMDFLQHSINKSRKTHEKRRFIPFSQVLVPVNFDVGKAKYGQINRIIDLVQDTNVQIKAIWSMDKLDKQTKYQMAAEVRQDCIDYIDKIQLDKHTMYWLLRSIESDQCKTIKRLIFNSLFGAPNKSFFSLIDASKSPIPTLVKDKNGNIDLYGIKFSKQY